MSSRQTRTLAAWVLAALTFGLAPAACIIPPETVHGPCAKDADCPDDKNPCTKAICQSNGFCDTEPQELKFGDKGCDDDNPCTDELCQEGACAHKPSNNPPDDGNECTQDECVNGQPKSTPLPDETKCGLDGQLSCHGGKCNCTKDEECGLKTECQVFDCANEACMSTNLDANVFVDGADPGDCHKRVCDGQGHAIVIADTSDPPEDATVGNCKGKVCDDSGTAVDMDDPSDVPVDDSNPCTEEKCNGGTPVNHVPVADGTVCGGTATCTLAAGGGYAETPADICLDGACTPQNAQSCGNFMCNPGGTACLDVCSGAGDCVTGTYCDPGSNSCLLAAGTGDACVTKATCEAGLECVDGVCCNGLCDGLCQRCDDPLSKGVCIPISSGQDPKNECTGSDVCDGLGGCVKQQGGTCMIDGDCLSGVCEDNVCCDQPCDGACYRCDLPATTGTCTAVDLDQQVTGCTGTKACDGNGNCKTLQGLTCGGNSECLSGFCEDSVCCDMACPGSCARCNLAGGVGTCGSVPQGQQPPGCGGTNACDGMGGCKKINGQTCTAGSECASGFCPDEVVGPKYCCNTDCTGTCQSCAAAKTNGTNGVCSNIKDKTDPDGECTVSGMTCNGGNGSHCCNGAGMCNP